MQGPVLLVPHRNAKVLARLPAFYDETNTFFGFVWHSGAKQGPPNTKRSAARWVLYASWERKAPAICTSSGM